MRRVIITGPTGAIGMALINLFEQAGLQVIAVVREASERKKQIQESEKVILVECALADMKELPDRVTRAMERCGWDHNITIDTFYHFAWAGAFGDGRNDMFLQNSNITHSLEAVDAAARLGCKTFIGAGSQMEYGRYEGKLNADVPVFPENGYGMAKLCAGQMTRIQCEKYGIRHIWTRILSVYGPYDGKGTLIMSLIASLLEGSRFLCTKGEQQWDYLYAKDAARIMFLLGEKGVHGKVYVVGSGSARPLKEYIEIIRNIISPELPVGYGEVAYSDKQIMYLCADIEELVRDTGFKEEYSFETGIKETIDYQVEKGKSYE